MSELIGSLNQLPDQSIETFYIFKEKEEFKRFGTFPSADYVKKIVASFSASNPLAYIPLRAFFKVLRFNPGNEIFSTERHDAFNQCFWRFGIVVNTMVNAEMVSQLNRITGVSNNLSALITNVSQNMYLLRAPRSKDGEEAYLALFTLLVKIVFKPLLYFIITSLPDADVRMIFGNYKFVGVDTPFNDFLAPPVKKGLRNFDFQNHAELKILEIQSAYRLVITKRLTGTNQHYIEDWLMALALKLGNVLFLKRLKLSTSYIQENVSSNFVASIYNALLQIDVVHSPENLNKTLRLLEYFRNTIVIMNTLNREKKLTNDIIRLRKSDFVQKFYPSYMAAEHYFFHLISSGEMYFMRYGVTDFFLDDEQKQAIANTKLSDTEWRITVDMLHHCSRKKEGRTFYDGWADAHLIYTPKYLNALREELDDTSDAQVIEKMEERLTYHKKHENDYIIDGRNDAEVERTEKEWMMSMLQKVYSDDELGKMKEYRGLAFESIFATAPRFFEMWSQTLYNYINNNPASSREFRIITQSCEFIESTPYVKVSGNEPFLQKLFSYYPGYLMVYYNDAVATRNKAAFAFDACIDYLKTRAGEDTVIVDDLNTLKDSNIPFFAKNGVFQQTTLQRIANKGVDSVKQVALKNTIEKKVTQKKSSMLEGLVVEKDVLYDVLLEMASDERLRGQLFSQTMIDTGRFPSVAIQWLVRIHAYAYDGKNKNGAFRFKTKEDECVFNIVHFYMARRRRQEGAYENFYAFIIRNNLQMMFNPIKKKLEASRSINYPNNEYNSNPYFEWMQWFFDQRPTVLPLLSRYEREFITDFLYTNPSFVPVLLKTQKEQKGESESKDPELDSEITRNVINELYKRNGSISFTDVFYRHVPSIGRSPIATSVESYLSYVFLLMYAYPKATNAVAASREAPSLIGLTKRETKVVRIIQHLDMFLAQKLKNVARTTDEQREGSDPKTYLSRLVKQMRIQYELILRGQDASPTVVPLVKLWENDQMMVKTIAYVNTIFINNMNVIQHQIVATIQAVLIDMYGNLRGQQVKKKHRTSSYLTSMTNRIEEWSQEIDVQTQQKRATKHDLIRFKRVTRILDIIHFLILTKLANFITLTDAAEEMRKRNVERSNAMLKKISKSKGGKAGESNAMRNMLNRIAEAKAKNNIDELNSITFYASLRRGSFFYNVLQNVSEMFIEGVFHGFEPLFQAILKNDSIAADFDQQMKTVDFPTFSEPLHFRNLVLKPFLDVAPQLEEMLEDKDNDEPDDEGINVDFIHRAAGDDTEIDGNVVNSQWSTMQNEQRREEEEEDEGEGGEGVDDENVVEALPFDLNPIQAPSTYNTQWPDFNNLNSSFATDEIPFTWEEPAAAIDHTGEKVEMNGIMYELRQFSSSQSDENAGFPAVEVDNTMYFLVPTSEDNDVLEPSTKKMRYKARFHAPAYFDERLTMDDKVRFTSKIGASMNDVSDGSGTPSFFILPYHADWYNRMPKSTKEAYLKHINAPVMLVASQSVGTQRLARDLTTFRVPQVVLL